jgi:hypothetical protein
VVLAAQSTVLRGRVLPAPAPDDHPHRPEGGDPMIVKAGDEHCWVVPFGDEGEAAHFPIEQDAVRWAARYDRWGRGASRLPVPCWFASCDGDGCFAMESNEDGDTVHIPAYTRKHVLSDLQELTRVDGGRLLCVDCVTKAKPQVPLGHRPPIFTEQDLSRVFSIVSTYADQLPGTHFDPQTEQLLTVVRRLVVKNPSGRYTWHSRVLPFAVQLPLPDMPAVAAVTEGSVTR